MRALSAATRCARARVVLGGEADGEMGAVPPQDLRRTLVTGVSSLLPACASGASRGQGDGFGRVDASNTRK